MSKTPSIRKEGPFTWIKADDRDVWDLKLPPNTGLTRFCIKNYGGDPGPGFAGWKLVSGGPFDQAGMYASFDDAVAGVVDFLIPYYRQQANKLIEDGRRMREAVASFERALGGGHNAP